MHKKNTNTKEGIYYSLIIRHFCTPISIMDKPMRYKIGKEMEGSDKI
jgi:hypothetical protein